MSQEQYDEDMHYEQGYDPGFNQSERNAALAADNEEPLADWEREMMAAAESDRAISELRARLSNSPEGVGTVVVKFRDGGPDAHYDDIRVDANRFEHGLLVMETSDFQATIYHVAGVQHYTVEYAPPF